MHRALQWPAKHKQQEGNTKRDADQSPVPETANDADAGREPDASRARKPLHLVLVAVNDHTGAQKADAGEDALDHAARRVR